MEQKAVQDQRGASVADQRPRWPFHWVAHYDSELVVHRGMPQPAELKITLNYYLEPGMPPSGNNANASDGTGATFPVVPWGPNPPQLMVDPTRGYHEGDWGRFKALFQQDAISFWNGKMWLKTPPECSDMDSVLRRNGKTWRPNVICGFTLNLVSDVNSAHVHAYSWRLGRINGRQPDPNVIFLDEKSFRSTPYVFDSFDVVPRGPAELHFDVGTLKKGAKFTQMPVAHEIGHALGLDHPFHMEDCATGPCSPNGEYGDSPNAEEWMPKNIMGMGKEIRPEANAKPWLNRIEKHCPSLAVRDGLRALAANTVDPLTGQRQSAAAQKPRTWVPGLITNGFQEGQELNAP